MHKALHALQYSTNRAHAQSLSDNMVTNFAGYKHMQNYLLMPAFAVGLFIHHGMSAGASLCKRPDLSLADACSVTHVHSF